MSLSTWAMKRKLWRQMWLLSGPNIGSVFIKQTGVIVRISWQTCNRYLFVNCVMFCVIFCERDVGQRGSLIVNQARFDQKAGPKWHHMESSCVKYGLDHYVCLLLCLYIVEILPKVTPVVLVSCLILLLWISSVLLACTAWKMSGATSLFIWMIVPAKAVRNVDVTLV